MTSLPEQFSAARQTQLDQGFSLMRSLSDQALDRTSRVLSLQLDASRAAVEQSSSTLRQLLAAREPRDLLALGSQSQQHLRTMFDFSRELFSLAATAYALPLRASSVAAPGIATPTPAAAPVRDIPAAAPAADAAAVAAEAFERVGADSASVAAASAALHADAPAAPATAPRGAADFVLPTETASEAPARVVTSAIVPDAAPNPIAQAAGAALDLPVAPPHPVAASVPVEVAVEIELPKIEPVDATPPPPAATTGPLDTRGTKGRRKQS